LGQFYFQAASRKASIVNVDARLIDSALRGWKLNIDRIDEFFHPLSEEQLQKEIAPGRNRLIYLWGHIAGFNDALFPLLGLGPKLYPDLENMFLSNPDRAVPTIYSGKELKRISTRINDALWRAYSKWSPAEWVEKHTSVSTEDFVKEPHRNRYTILLTRTMHMALHFGQVVLTKPRKSTS